MQIILKRICENKHGTFGILLQDNNPLCLTVERPWINNKENESCIPLGQYDCIKHNGSKFKDVWELTNVPNRKNILIHAGNSIDDTIGCILVGSIFSAYGLSCSKIALELLRGILPDKFTITIGD